MNETTTALNLRSNRTWLAALDELVAAAGYATRGEYLDRLIARDASRLGHAMPDRLRPSKFDGYAARRNPAGRRPGLPPSS